MKCGTTTPISYKFFGHIFRHNTIGKNSRLRCDCAFNNNMRLQYLRQFSFSQNHSTKYVHEQATTTSAQGTVVSSSRYNISLSLFFNYIINYPAPLRVTAWVKDSGMSWPLATCCTLCGITETEYGITHINPDDYVIFVCYRKLLEDECYSQILLYGNQDCYYSPKFR